MRSRSLFHTASRWLYILLLGVLAALIGTSNRGFAQEDESAPDDELLSSFGNYFSDSEVELIDFQQPGATVRPPSAVRRPSRRPATGQELAAPSESETGDYLASAPRMFGHAYGPVGQLVTRSTDAFGKNNILVTDIPMAGGGSRLQIADNNFALAQSRFFFNYNHFENAIRTNFNGQRLFQGVDQYTMGMEQAIMGGVSSWQLQMPMTGGFASPGNPGVTSGQLGNLGFIAKTVVWRGDYASLAGGMGMDLPTGASTNGLAGAVPFRLGNSSTHLSPFLGFMALPTDSTFFQSFLSVDVPASGNTFFVNGSRAGVFTTQPLMSVDVMGGQWFYQNFGGGGITGVALLGEVHYLGALSGGDNLNASGFRNGGATFQLGNLSGQQYVVNMTTGLQILWNDKIQFRIGGAFPLANRPNRSFDGEVIAQVNYIPY